jgi:hypothetical protein
MPGINLEYATDHIWTMEDKEGFIGLRVDCGDSGVVYFTPSQALDVVAAFSAHLNAKIMKVEFKQL